jgi:hypothetical protein
MEIWFGIDRRSVGGITCTLRHAVIIPALTMLTIVMIKVRVWLQYFSDNAGLGDVHTPTLSLSPGGMDHESCRVGEG